MNYTKGEWQIGGHGNHRFEILTDRRIAIVDTWDDALLIRAAPKMCLALEELIEFCQTPKGEVGRSYLADVVRQAIKALAKAEGKE